MDEESCSGISFHLLGKYSQQIGVEHLKQHQFQLSVKANGLLFLQILLLAHDEELCLSRNDC